MRRRFIILSALLLLVLIPGVVFAQAKPGAGMYFRLCTHGGDDPFWAVVTKGMQDACAELGCKADIDLVGGDVSALQKAFLTAVASKPDGIALVINDDNAYNKAVADAVAKGINVIGINNDHSKGAAGNARLCYIGQNESNAGYSIALRLFQAGKAKGVNFATAKVACAVEVPGANYGKVRASGIQRAMDEFGIKSKIDIIDGGGLEMTTAEQRITSYLVAHPDTTFLFGLGGICTDRLTAALKNTNKKPGQILAGGFDATPGTIDGLNSGYMEASIDQQQYLQGYYAVYTLYLMKRYGFAPNIDTGGFLITKNNIAMIQKLSAQHIR
ncbi:MAG TPA: substrate-binding domain-containing protein [Spirochaetia bacterium]